MPCTFCGKINGHYPSCPEYEDTWVDQIERREHPEWCKCQRVCGGDQ